MEILSQEIIRSDFFGPVLLPVLVSFFTTVILFIVKYIFLDYWDKKNDLRANIYFSLERWAHPITNVKINGQGPSSDTKMSFYNEIQKDYSICRYKIRLLKSYSMSFLIKKLLNEMERDFNSLSELVVGHPDHHNKIVVLRDKIFESVEKM